MVRPAPQDYRFRSFREFKPCSTLQWTEEVRKSVDEGHATAGLCGTR
ncbi:MAG: hypothetical protein ACLUVZ_17470 [Bacteroides stercoris]